jgi:hypothetical protein
VSNQTVTGDEGSGTATREEIRLAEVRKVFDTVIADQSDPARVANLELCREYFTNPAFRKFLEDTTARINEVAA